MRKLALIFTVLFMALSVPLQASAASLYEVRQILKNEYYGEIDGDIYDAQSIEELMKMMKDPYTVYMTKEQYIQFNQSIEQEIVGIGISIDEHEKGVYISEVFNNGPAQSAGLKPGDIITHADGTSLAGMPLNNAVTYITGAENTSVSLTILRADGSSNELSIIRKTIQMPNVVTSLLAGNVGYIYLASFSENGAKEISNAIGNLKKQGATSFIFDLQNNGGGVVDTAIDIISLFPNAVKAFMLHDAAGIDAVNVNSNRTRYYNKFPSSKHVSLLINGGSASASDMTAAAVKDQKLAKIYGSTSYGKGLMQGMYLFRDGSALKVTIGEFRSPNGSVINNVGVEPDVETKTAIQDAHFDLLKNNLSNYKELKSLTNVPTTKTFTVKLTHKADANSLQNAFELVMLGGQKVDVSTKITGTSISITPIEKLQPGAHYALIAHPTLKNVKGKTLKQGNYTKISVAK